MDVTYVVDCVIVDRVHWKDVEQTLADLLLGVVVHDSAVPLGNHDVTDAFLQDHPKALVTGLAGHVDGCANEVGSWSIVSQKRILLRVDHVGILLRTCQRDQTVICSSQWTVVAGSEDTSVGRDENCTAFGRWVDATLGHEPSES